MRCQLPLTDIALWSFSLAPFYGCYFQLGASISFGFFAVFNAESCTISVTACLAWMTDVELVGNNFSIHLCLKLLIMNVFSIVVLYALFEVIVNRLTVFNAYLNF